jgi:hypothetical protein
MILSVHATFGAAVASLVPNHPVMGFVLGFASHLALDAIPHQDYKLVSMETDPNQKLKTIDLIQEKFALARDVLFVSFDALVGFCLAFMFFFNPAHPTIFFIGAFGALLPDGLTFLYLLFKHKALSHFFDFHTDFIHYKIHLNQVLGIILQFFTIAILIGILMIAKYYYFLLI